MTKAASSACRYRHRVKASEERERKERSAKRACKQGTRRTRLFGCTASMTLRCKGGVIRCSEPLVHWRQFKWRLRNRRRLMVPTEGTAAHAHGWRSGDWTPVKAASGSTKRPWCEASLLFQGVAQALCNQRHRFHMDGTQMEKRTHSPYVVVWQAPKKRRNHARVRCGSR